MKFLHVTDPHLVPAGEPLCALAPSERLRAVVADIARTQADADFMVLTGDLSYHGREPAYRELRAILADLEMPCHLLIGNHDDRAAFQRIFPETPRDENGFVQYVVECEAGAFIMLDTVEDGAEGGVLCPARLDWLAARLDERAGEAVFVFLHHPPHAIGIGALDSSRLAQAAPLAELLRAHGGVRHIFYGHVHRAIAGSWHGIPATTLPGTNHQVGLHLGPEDEMVGTHEPPAYGVVLIEDESVSVHQRYFLDRSPRFQLMDPRSKRAARAAELVPASAPLDRLV